MTLIPPKEDKRCYIACPEWKVKQGLCGCANRANNMIDRFKEFNQPNPFEQIKNILKENNLDPHDLIGTVIPKEDVIEYVGMQDPYTALQEHLGLKDVENMPNMFVDEYGHYFRLTKYGFTPINR